MFFCQDSWWQSAPSDEPFAEAGDVPVAHVEHEEAAVGGSRDQHAVVVAQLQPRDAAGGAAQVLLLACRKNCETA